MPRVANDTFLGERFNDGLRTPAWRAVRNIFDFSNEQVSVWEAMERMHLNYDVSVQPLYTEIGGDRAVIDDTRAIVRTSSNGFKSLVLGFCGPDWQPVQNREIANLLQPIADRYTLDSLGSVNDGRDLIAVFHLGTTSVNDDRLDDYLVVRNAHKQGQAVKFAIIPVRFHCTNQLVAGKGANFIAPVLHREGVTENTHFALQVFNFLDAARNRVHQSFQRMSEVNLTKSQITKLLDAAFPEVKPSKNVRMLASIVAASGNNTINPADFPNVNPEEFLRMETAYRTYVSAQEKIKIHKSDVKLVLERFNDEHPNFANTGWAVYNALIEYSDWRGSPNNEEATFDSTIYGVGAREKTAVYDSVMKIVAPDHDRVNIENVEFEGLPERSTASSNGHRGRPRKEKTLEQIAAEELRNQRRTERLARRGTPEEQAQRAQAKAEAMRLRAEKAMHRAQSIEERAKRQLEKFQQYLQQEQTVNA